MKDERRYDVTYVERSEVVKHASIEATSLEEAQEIADEIYNKEFQSDGMGESFGREVLGVELTDDEPGDEIQNQVDLGLGVIV
jgi:hypothetical protein